MNLVQGLARMLSRRASLQQSRALLPVCLVCTPSRTLLQDPSAATLSHICSASGAERASSQPAQRTTHTQPRRPSAATCAATDSEATVQHEDTACVRVTIRQIAGDTAELLSDCLLGNGATSVVVVEHRADGAPEQEIFEEPGSASAGLWDTCDVVAYYPLEAEDPTASVSESLQILGLTAQDTGGIALEPVANTQWVDQIKWSDPPSDPSALNIIMQPGVAFGTGEHPTTRLCLQALESMDSELQGARLMDYGTGSGVLALAALLLGARSAVGTDTDSLAVRSALRNAQLTHVADRFQAFVCGPHIDDPEPLSQAGYSETQFEFVVANILRGPLIELQPRLAAYCAPGATLLLSGILAEQVPDIQAAYAGAFEAFNVSQDGTWACITARRRRSA